ncbi:hypothetical protein ABR738_00440 [Streptomyces sp. Edi4]|uniref:hypothetical protein n=1 Tax=Streptomyces sp. Edi4 TaxID=3162527 RepID=UPI003305B051
MSTTPDYDMAPPAAAATAPSPAAGQPLASGAAAATDPGAQRPQRRRAASQKDESLAGLLIPGGIITGLISLCWLVHAFGLPIVIFAILAAAATAVTAVAIKAGRRAAKAAGRTRLGRGGGGPGGGRGGGRAGGRSGGGRSGVGNRSGGTGPSRRSGGGSKGSNAPGLMSRKPSGLGSLKSSPRTGPKNSSKGGLGGRSGLGGSRSTAGPKPLKGSPTKGGLGGAKDRKGLGNSASGGRGGLLGKLTSGIGTSPKGTGSGKSNRKKAPGGLGGGSGTAPKSPKRTPKGTTAPTGTGGGKSSTTPGSGKPTAPKTPKSPKGGKGKGKGKHRHYTWKKNPLRKSRGLAKSAYVKGKGLYRAGKRGAAWGYRKVTSSKFRRRLHQAATPFRAMYRGTRKHGGKLMANALRVGGRWVLGAHSFLGHIRLSTKGPNWLKPLSKVLYWATSPLAKLVNVSRRWTWLSAWIYKTATARPITKPVTASGPTAPTAGTGAPAPATVPGSRTSVPSPATAPAGGTPVDTSPVHHAYPLIYAADAIRMAAASFAAAPADSMKGYENVIENLGHLEFAMCHLMHDIAQVTEDDFKVNPEIPNQFRNVGIQFLSLGQFVDATHKVFRDVHAEQLENLENPTWQGRKWDVSANWAHIMPQFAWQDPTAHALPLMLASGAIRDAGIHIRLHPSGSMFGYEMTIEHLAPLAEALYVLMETVASTTESEFAVHPAIPAMHRDAGQRFRDLGGAIQAVHLLYRLLHQEQLHNIENPTYQGAKWDVGRNAP